jgi:invasion protein IalB
MEIIERSEMSREYRVMLVAAAAVGLTAPTLAQTPTQSSAAVQKPNDPNEVVCRKEESTGSRIGAKRVCMTRMQWADRQLQDRLELERTQVQRGTGKGE